MKKKWFNWKFACSKGTYRPYHYIIVGIALVLMLIASGVIVHTVATDNWIWVK